MKYDDSSIEVVVFDRTYSMVDDFTVLSVELPIDFIPKVHDKILITTKCTGRTLAYDREIKKCFEYKTIENLSIKKWAIYIDSVDYIESEDSIAERVITMPGCTTIKFLLDT